MRARLIDGEYYHIYNRGNGKHKIFLCHEDYVHFIKLLYICNSETGFKFRDSIVDLKIDAWDFDRGKPIIDISAWVLMSNHFHILLSSHRSDLWEVGYNPITEYMRKVMTAYVMYFNKKYQRTGSLFEGKFKSIHVNSDEYLRYLFAYFHFNPIKLIQSNWREVGIKNKDEVLAFLASYPYSSFPDFLKMGKRKESKILSNNFLPEFFHSAHVNELFDWIKNFPQVGPVGNSRSSF